jgi:hypothetical protein
MGCGVCANACHDETVKEFEVIAPEHEIEEELCRKRAERKQEQKSSPI